MAESLWMAIDDWFCTTLMAELGDGNPNSYETLLLEQVEPTDSVDAVEGNVIFPAIFLVSSTAVPSFGNKSRCGDLVSEETTYNYTLLFDVTAETRRSAKECAATTFRRVMRFFRKYPCPPVSIATGESVGDLELQSAQIRIEQGPGGHLGEHKGRMIFEFNIIGRN